MAGSDLLLQDANLSASGYLPAAGATGATSLMDLGLNVGLGQIGQADWQRTDFSLTLPTLTTAQAISGTSITYQILTSDVATTNAASAVPMYTIPTSIAPSAASSGIVGQTFYFRPPIGGVHRYMWASATAAASTLATSATMTLAALF